MKNDRKLTIFHRFFAKKWKNDSEIELVEKKQTAKRDTSKTEKNRENRFERVRELEKKRVIGDNWKLGDKNRKIDF